MLPCKNVTLDLYSDLLQGQTVFRNRQMLTSCISLYHRFCWEVCSLPNCFLMGGAACRMDFGFDFNGDNFLWNILQWTPVKKKKIVLKVQWHHWEFGLRHGKSVLFERYWWYKQMHNGLLRSQGAKSSRFGFYSSNRSACKVASIEIPGV